MIVTVTLNTGIDRTLVVPTFQWNTTLRAQEVVYGMGGKATDASWVLGELGIENLALGMAAGESGRQMERMLQKKGVKTHFTWVEGETRTNTILISAAGEGQTTITANSLVVRPRHVEEFVLTYQDALAQASCIIIGGTQPPGMHAKLYPELIALARAQNIPVVFDASGPDNLLGGLSAHPTLIKPNRVELEEIVRRPLNDLAEIYRAAAEIRQQYGSIVVATLGSQGALAVAQDQAYFIEPLSVEVKSTAGAGDAILAGLAHSLAARLPLEEGLRLGFAAAAAVLLTLPTADCRREDVIRLMPQVSIRSYPQLP